MNSSDTFASIAAEARSRMTEEERAICDAQSRENMATLARLDAAVYGSPEPSPVNEVTSNLGVDYVPTGKFRIQNQKLMLTYRSKLPKAEFKDWFNTLVGNTKVIEMAHETGMSKGIPYEHTHVVVDFGRNYQTTNVRKFDYKDIHPNIKKITTITHWNNCMNYLAKEDPENAHLKKETSIVNIVWSKDSMEEALLSTVKKPSDVMGIVQLYNMKPQAPYIVSKPTLAWCDTIINIFSSDVEDFRTIYWYWDPLGCSGKTWLVKHLYTNDPHRYWFCNQVGGMYHFANNVSNAIKSGWNQKCALFNLCRADELKEFYKPLEALKDGLITTVKYQGGTHCFPSPHIVVMANFPPDISQLSQDRWKVFHIKEDKTTELVFDKSSKVDTLSKSLLTIKGTDGVSISS